MENDHTSPQLRPPTVSVMDFLTGQPQLSAPLSSPKLVLDIEVDSLPEVQPTPSFPQIHRGNILSSPQTSSDIDDIKMHLSRLLSSTHGQQILMDVLPGVLPTVNSNNTNKQFSQNGVFIAQKSKRKFPVPKVKYSGVVGTLEGWTTEWRNYFRSDSVTNELEKVALVRESLQGPVKLSCP